MQVKNIRRTVVLKMLLAAGITLFFTILFPTSGTIEEPRNAEGIWTDNDFFAPFSFPIYKAPQAYEQERIAAAHSVNPVVERAPTMAKIEIDSLPAKIARVKAAADACRKWKSTRRGKDSTAFAQRAGALGFTAIDWDSVSRWAGGKENIPRDLAAVQFQVTAILSDLYRVGVLDSGLLKREYKTLSVRTGNIEEPLPAENVRALAGAQTELRTRLNDHFGENSISDLAFALGSSALVPNIRYDAVQTGREVQAALEDVPRTQGYVQEGERIIGKNERITNQVKMKLDSYRRAMEERGTEIDMRGQHFGVILHVLLILGIYATYLFLFRKKIFHNVKLLALIAVIFCIEGLLACLSRVIDVSFPAQYLILVPAASMLLTIIFDSRVAFYGTVTLALLIGGIRGNDYAIMLSSVIAGSLGAYTVRDIRSRTQILRSLGFIFLGYAFTVVGLALERFESFQSITIELTLVFANALISSVFTYAMLIVLERFFNITTDLRLMELVDFNQPLLQRLSEEAPGTFHHSVLLGNLAEAAADDVGANSILARVGAYYHDVGKLVKPEYFVENQGGQPNRHTKLRPRMSARVIISHVTEGIELARQYGIPEKVVDFIPQHHGTTRISYFFDKALKQAASRKNSKDVVREEDYRYPGPKPQTREAAIVMLADTVEATTRSITEITPQKLESTVDAMIKQRFVEGELDDCELTMRDLTKIRRAFQQILIGIHHHRIQYPEPSPPPAPQRAARRISRTAQQPQPEVQTPESAEPAQAEEIPPTYEAPTPPDQPIFQSETSGDNGQTVPDQSMQETIAETISAPDSSADEPAYDTFGEGVQHLPDIEPDQLPSGDLPSESSIEPEESPQQSPMEPHGAGSFFPPEDSRERSPENEPDGDTAEYEP